MERDLAPVPVAESAAPVIRRVPCDGVFATVVLSSTRLLATCYWARHLHHGKPLLLCDYQVGPLSGSSWKQIEIELKRWHDERRSRFPHPVAVYVETEMIATQAEAAGLPARAIPAWLTNKESWSQIAQSAAAILARGDVGYTAQASRRMDERPFLAEAGIAAGPRPEDPTTPAFLFGIILGLDPAAARDPHPKQIVRASRK